MAFSSPSGGTVGYAAHAQIAREVLAEAAEPDRREDELTQAKGMSSKISGGSVLAQPGLL